MAITVSTNFELNSNIPLDKRIVMEDEVTMEALDKSTLYPGLICYCKNSNTHYFFNGSDWKSLVKTNIGDWAFKGSYSKNEIVIYNKVFYRCLTDIAESTTDPSFDVARWEAIGGSTGSGSSSATGNTRFLGFVPNYAYSYGDTIRHNEILYTANKSFVSADEFNRDDWSLTTGDLKSSVHDKDNSGIIDVAERALTADYALESELLMTWKPNNEYLASQQVVYKDKIYSVVANHTSPLLWDPNDPNLTLIATGFHNELLNLQGGKTDEYYHMNDAQYQIISNFKIDESDNIHYKDKYVGDMSTVVYDKNKDGVVDKAATLEGLSSTIKELNYSVGLTGNIQEQFNLLTGVSNFTQTVPTYADLLKITGKEKDMVIVTADETHGNVTTVYIHNGTDWQYVSPFTATVRDFSTSPIDLITESTGILPETRIPNEIARKSDLTSFANADLLATYDQTNYNIKDAVNKKHRHNNLDLLESYNQLNNDIASAVTLKHKHDNISIINSFDESSEGKLLYKGIVVGSGGGGGGITDLSMFTTQDLNDSLNRRYVTDTDKANLANLTSIVANQSTIQNTLNEVKATIPSDASSTNKLISSATLSDKINNITFFNLKDVDNAVLTNAFLTTNEDGTQVGFKSNISDLIKIKKVIDKNGDPFMEVQTLEFENLVGNQTDNHLKLSWNKLYTTDLDDMPTMDGTVDNGKLLIADGTSLAYKLVDIKELSKDRPNFVIQISESDWIDNDGTYYYTIIEHNLNSRGLICAAYDDLLCDIKTITFKILDDQRIELHHNNPINCAVVINCSQGTVGYGNGTGSGVVAGDFIDDTKPRADKTYSSQKIENDLTTLYAKKTAVYDKMQADAKFALKSNEHIHTNKTVLDNFSEDDKKNLLYKGNRIITELKADTYILNFVSHESQIALDVLIDTNNVFLANNYMAIMQQEFTIKNNNPKTGTDEDNKKENQVHLVVTDNTLVLLDVYIEPEDTQKYLLGISPNIKVMAQLPNGNFDANFCLTAY